jgi:sugar phosphate isomerase/epimerase
MISMLDRRSFLHRAAAAGACLALNGAAVAAPTPPAQRYAFCAFTKYLQSLNFVKLAETIANAGFQGVEAPVRDGGHFNLEAAPDKLPELADALQQRGLAITILTTDVLRADQPHVERALRTAAGLGITRYRLGFYRYDLKRPVIRQLDELRPILKDLAALNRELGLQGVYQNHSGADMVGATLWDIYRLIEDLSSDDVAIAFDIRHATIEAGLAWPAIFNAMCDRIAAVFVKDFQWKNTAAEHVQLGKGRVDRKFFSMLETSDFSGPISVHVEYLRSATAQDNATALRDDLVTLRGWLAS